MRRSLKAARRPDNAPRRSAALAILLLMTGFPVLEALGQTVHPTQQAATLDSWFALDPAALNKRIAILPEAIRTVATDPVLLVHHLIGRSGETPRLSITLQSDAADEFTPVTVTAIRDGFLDDSLRGDWHRFRLAQDAKGAWSVIHARKAWRCWRSNKDRFTSAKCN